MAPQNQLADPYTGLSFAECLARLQPEDKEHEMVLAIIGASGATDFKKCLAKLRQNVGVDLDKICWD